MDTSANIAGNDDISVGDVFSPQADMSHSHKDINIAASRVAEPEFWEFDSGWYFNERHMTLPHDLLLKLGILGYELTDFEIEQFLSSEY